MSLSMHSLKPARGAKRYPKRVGRGNASGKGTTAGRGSKGQTARSGGRGGLKLLGMRHMILQTPKLRGFQSQHAKARVVTLRAIAKAYKAGEVVNPKSLAKKGLVVGMKGAVKVLDGGKFTQKLAFAGLEVSAAAKEKIVAAGGEVKE